MGKMVGFAKLSEELVTRFAWDSGEWISERRY